MDLKSSMTKNYTQWNDYLPCETPCPTTGGYLYVKNQIIIR